MGASPDLPDEHHHRPLRGQHPRQRDHRDGAAPLHPHAAEIPQVNFRKRQSFPDLSGIWDYFMHSKYKNSEGEGDL